MAKLGFQVLDGGHRFLVGSTDEGQGQRPQGEVVEAAAVFRNVVVLALGNGGREDLDLPR